jgi:hypothetical protein
MSSRCALIIGGHLRRMAREGRVVRTRVNPAGGGGSLFSLPTDPPLMTSRVATEVGVPAPTIALFTLADRLRATFRVGEPFTRQEAIDRLDLPIHSAYVREALQRMCHNGEAERVGDQDPALYALLAVAIPPNRRGRSVRRDPEPQDQLADRITAILHPGERLTTSEVAERLGVEPSAQRDLSDYLCAMARHGRLERANLWLTKTHASSLFALPSPDNEQVSES